jgi:hypothetical protein
MMKTEEIRAATTITTKPTVNNNYRKILAAREYDLLRAPINRYVAPLNLIQLNFMNNISLSLKYGWSGNTFLSIFRRLRQANKRLSFGWW